MKCEDLLKLVNDYVEGEIDPEICERFEAHLAHCNPCQVVVDTVRKTITLYQDRQVYEMPMAFRSRLHAAMRARWKQLHEQSDDR